MNTNSLQSLQQAELGFNYIRIPDTITDSDLGALCNTVLRCSEASLFWIGDVLNFLQDRKGAHYTKNFEECGYEPKTLRNAKSLCRAFPPEKRLKVSFSHHDAAKTEATRDDKTTGQKIIDLDFALKYLQLAEREHLSVSTMRKHMRLQLKTRLPKPLTMDEITKEIEFITARDAINSIRRYLEKIDSTTDPIAKNHMFNGIEALFELAKSVCAPKGDS